MSIRIVRLGTARHPKEGVRIGAVRRPPRGVRKEDYASDDWYDVWYPNLAPTPEAVKQALAASTPAEWTAFVRRYRKEMKEAEPRRTLDLLAALSHHADFSLGCYCENEERCHRSVLRELLEERGASIVDADS